MIRPALPLLLAAACAAPTDATDDTGTPFDSGDTAADRGPTMPTVTRTPAGEPLTGAERAAFTQAVTGFWKDVGWFTWIARTSHGLDASANAEHPWMVWWQDTQQIKDGDTITFRHTGGADNLMIRTSKVLGATAAALVHTDDPTWTTITSGYARGTAALFQGMVWGDAPAETWPITARAIFPSNHAYTLDGGREVVVDYDPVKKEKYSWNAHTVPNDDNPFFGPDLWVRNMRSKDDVPHMWRMVPALDRLAETTDDAALKASLDLARDHLRAMGRDVVEQGWALRSIEDGEIWTPVEDLAHFDYYVFGDATEPECTARYAAAWLADAPEAIDGADCGDGFAQDFEDLSRANYYNLVIWEQFHLAALQAAVLWGDDDTARRLMDGLVLRTETRMAEVGMAPEKPFDPDTASFLVTAAATGLPLTAAEQRLVVDEYTAAIAHYATWPNWDPWDDSVPDGVLADKPPRGDGETDVVRPSELAWILEVCASPWGQTADWIDCDVVLDPSRWGED